MCFSSSIAKSGSTFNRILPLQQCALRKNLLLETLPIAMAEFTMHYGSSPLHLSVFSLHVPARVKVEQIRTSFFRKPPTSLLSLESKSLKACPGKKERQRRSPSPTANCALESLEGEVDNEGDASRDDPKLRAKLRETIASLKCNAVKAKERGLHRHSLGVDLGDVKTGIAISLGGFAPRPLRVVRKTGDKLLEVIISIAEQEKADEFVVGLPKSWDGKDNKQASKCRSFAGRLASLAARRGWRVYLQDEYGTSQDALSYMIETGSNRRSRKEQIDAYAAMALLCNYFEAGGSRAQLVVPKQLDLQQLLCQGPTQPLPFDLSHNDCFGEFDDDEPH